ncbi:MAG: DNA polymerase IV [Candidatus Acidiferrales bacterium]
MPKLARFRAKHDPPEAKTAAAASETILHIDMDAFFVSVELLERPELRGLPVVVGGQPDQRGVVSSASYEARKFGIHSAMALRTAGRLCPQAVYLECRHELYSQWSDRVAEILARFTPAVEMASVDEGYLDLTGTERMHGPPLAAADKLLREITAKTELPCSGGLAATRLVAKVASDQAKPRGLVFVPAGAEEAFLAPLGVRKIPGIGKMTEAALKALGIRSVGELASVPLGNLEETFGQWGTALYRKARGQDAFEFFVDAEPKSISHNHTFGQDTDDRALIETTLSHLSQKAAKRLRDSGLYARTIGLSLRHADFRTLTRAKTLAEPTNLDSRIHETLKSLLAASWPGVPKLRLVGVELSQLTSPSGQMDLLDAGRREKLEKLARTTDRLRDRFGFAKIQFGGSLNNKNIV